MRYFHLSNNKLGLLTHNPRFINRFLLFQHTPFLAASKRYPTFANVAREMRKTRAANRQQKKRKTGKAIFEILIHSCTGHTQEEEKHLPADVRQPSCHSYRQPPDVPSPTSPAPRQATSAPHAPGEQTYWHRPRRPRRASSS